MEATLENLAKWIDELTGEIEQLKKKLGTGGGSRVTITPALESGTKVADYTIGETEGSLYAPTVPATIAPFINVSDVIVAQTAMTNNNFEYTATQDCIVKFELCNTTSGSARVYIDNVVIRSVYSSESKVLVTDHAFVKKGQVIKTLGNNTNTSETGTLTYAVYGLQQATQPVISKK